MDSAVHSVTIARMRFLVIFTVVCAEFGTDAEAVDRTQIASAMRKAVEFYRNETAVHGGYVYHYSLDLSVRWGEGRAGDKQIWVQPPGTPTVGTAMLKAYEVTGDVAFLDGAREAAEALAFGQLRGGGWTNSIDLSGFGQDRRPKEGNCSLDDGQTQSAIMLIVLVDAALGFEHERIHECALSALDALLAAQFENGGFPQVWRGSVATNQPVARASYPAYDWRTEGRVKNYWDYYTINDNVCGYVADALLTAHVVYKNPKYMAALNRLGDFLVLAQMPDPQPAWAQQYNYEMHPIWARKFEPPAIAGDESQEVIETLLKIADATGGDRKYLKPIPPALAYLKRSLLSDGRLARCYELGTNRPLYMSRRGKVYSLTYDDSNLPKHYGWKSEPRLEELDRRYRMIENGETENKVAAPSEEDIARIIADLDDHGRWISVYRGEPLVGQAKFKTGARYISSAVFAANLEKLSRYLESTR